MVDAERLRRVLQRVAADAQQLARYASRPAEDVLADEAAIGHIKYLFVTAIEGCINAAHHIGASEGLEPPATNADSIRILARHGFLAGDLAESIASAVGFRNILVHQYTVVEDRRVVEHLKRVGDLDAFVAALSRLV